MARIVRLTAQWLAQASSADYADDEDHVFDHGNIVERIARHRNDVRITVRLQLSDVPAGLVNLDEV